ncbi:MAG: iron ABC transporter permease [Treponema sp.]|nr:iron ABC transporter permease [Treponema sp.]
MKPHRGSISSSFWFLALPPLLAVSFCFVLPYGASFYNALSGGDRITVFQGAYIWRITAFTLWQAFYSVLISLALGLPGAWFIGTSRSRFAPLLRTLTGVPFAMPSILVVLGFVLFFGNSGWVNTIILALRGEPEGTGPLRILYRPQAIILAHGFFNFPLVVRLAGDGLGRAQKAYGAAAASLGASPAARALTVIFPLAWPGILSAALLVFLYSFTSFAVVLVLGGGPAASTLAVEIYRHGRIFLNYHNAGALALMETAIAVTVFMAYASLAKKARGMSLDLQERVLEGEGRSPLGRLVLVIYGIAAALFILGPLASILLESFLQQTSRASAQSLSLRWWGALGDSYLPALLRSLVLALSAASLACVLAILGAAFVKLLENQGKANSFGALLIRFASASPVISSGIVLGLGWLIIYGRTFSRSPAALVLLHAVVALPFAFNSISEGFRSLPANTLNAAMVFGAGPLKAFFGTALPLSLKQVRSAWGFAAALSLGELNAVMMLGMEGWETLPLFIYRAAGAYRYGIACAAGTLLILCCAGAFILSDMGAKRYDS